MRKVTYHIHWRGQPQPDSTPWASLAYARDAAIKAIQVDEHYSIVEVGQSGWPHDYNTVFTSWDEEAEA